MIRAGVLTVARGVLLAGPTALAFFTGGYFPEAQAWAGLLAWVLVAVALVVVPLPPRLGRPFWLAWTHGLWARKHVRTNWISPDVT